MDREHRREIKEDEFASALGQTVAWVHANADRLKLGAGVGVLVVAGIWAFATFRESRQRDAARDFAAAMKVFEQRSAEEMSAGPEASTAQFKTVRERMEKALAGFEGVERRHGSFPEGRRARLYAALCRIELGQFAEAEKGLAALAQSGDTLEQAAARLALAEGYRKARQTEKALEAYRKLAEDAAGLLPRDQAIMGMAGTLEEASRLDEARQSYRRLYEEFPTSVYAAEARRRADHLGSGSAG